MGILKRFVALSIAVVGLTGAGRFNTPEGIVLAPLNAGADGDTAQIQAALNNPGNLPVILQGGAFNVCHELFIPTNGLLIMEGIQSGTDINFPDGGPPNTYLTCTGTFSGVAVVDLAGRYAVARGLAVYQPAGQPQSTSFTGSISGTTLTATPCGVLQVSQGVNDSHHTDLIAEDTIVTAVGTCTSGSQTYTINISQTVASETMYAVVACAEARPVAGTGYGINPTWSMLDHFFLDGCTGDGFRAVADSTFPGEQNTNGDLGNIKLVEGYIYNNFGNGVLYTTIQMDGTANVTDPLIYDVYIGANGHTGVFFGTHAGGQPELSKMKIDFNSGACMHLQGGQYIISDIICDNNYGDYADNATGAIWISFQASYQIAQITNVIFLNRDATMPVGFYFNSNAWVTLNNIFNQNLNSLFQVANGSTISGQISVANRGGWYADTASGLAIEPLLSGGINSQNITISASTFTPVFDGLTRNFEVDFPTSCSPSPCVIGNPTYVPANQSGIFTFKQPGSGTTSTSPTFQSDYYASAVPTLTNTLGAVDRVPYTTDGTGHITFYPIRANVH